MVRTTIQNPIIWADVPDIDIIQSNGAYYMVSTSMHMMPGCPIMKSKDLAHWEIVNYVYQSLEDNDAHNLRNGKHIYGQGSWAASLKEHKGIFYVCFSSNDMHQFYVYKTKDIENGEWSRTVIPGLFHDPALLFDEDDRVYVIYGNGDIFITELTADASAIKIGGINQMLLEGERDGIGLRCEGCHAYKINGAYYLFFIEWPANGNKRRRELCYRSNELLGPYESKIILDHHMGHRNNGVAQGGVIEIANEWYAFLFQDREAVGRIPILVPVTWENGWPIVGVNGEVPELLDVNWPSYRALPIVRSDDFNYNDNRLQLNWQWNHNPNPALWSVIAKAGHLRLITGDLVDSVLHARNTLTQRTEGPACKASIKLDIEHMKPGDHSGLIALQNTFGTVGIRKNELGETSVTMTVNNGSGKEELVESITYTKDVIYLQVAFEFEQSLDIADFSYSVDGDNWIRIGQQLQMKYTLDHFMGYRIGIFNYATVVAGGYVDIDYFHFQKRLNQQYLTIE